MEVTLNTENFKSNTTITHCYACKKQVEADILAEYSYYTQFYHEHCQTEWTFSDYKRCEALRKQSHSRLVAEIEPPDPIGRAVIDLILFTKVGWLIGGVTSLVTGGAAIPVITAIAVRTGSGYIEKNSQKNKAECALSKSYDITDFFKERKNHHYDDKFLKQAKAILMEISLNPYK